MATLRAEEFRVETKDISGQKVSFTYYKIGDRYHCHVANIDPGATVTRVEGKTKEETEQIALKRALEKLTTTKR